MTGLDLHNIDFVEGTNYLHL